MSLYNTAYVVASSFHNSFNSSIEVVNAHLNYLKFKGKLNPSMSKYDIKKDHFIHIQGRSFYRIKITTGFVL